MKNILISVDLCESFMKDQEIKSRILEILEGLSSKNGIEYLKSFDKCLYFFDFNYGNKHELYHTQTNEYAEDYGLYRGGYDYDELEDVEDFEFGDNNSYVKYFSGNGIEKEYGFFRDLMDSGYDNDFIIKLGQIMLKNNIHILEDIKSIKTLDTQKEDEKYVFDNLENFEGLSFYFPLDLMKQIEKKLSNKDINITLIGGGLNECLKEIYILLKIMGYNHIKINEKYTY